MKKKYVRPAIFAEDLKLQSIIATCASSPGHAWDDWDDDEVTWIFTSAMSTCSDEGKIDSSDALHKFFGAPEGAEGSELEAYCYNLLTEGVGFFSS